MSFLKRTAAARREAVPRPPRPVHGRVRPRMWWVLLAGIAWMPASSPAQQSVENTGLAETAGSVEVSELAGLAEAAVPHGAAEVAGSPEAVAGSPTPAETPSAAPSSRSSRSSAPVRTRVELYEIEDRKLLLQLWAYTDSPEQPGAGNWQVMLVTDSVQRGWILREGTQAAVLPEHAIDWIRYESRAATREGRLSRTTSDGFWANFWNPDDPLEPYQWPTGFRVSTGLEATAFRRTTMQNVQRMDFTFAQQPWPWLTTEVGGHFERHMGGLRRNLTNPLDTLAGWNAWSTWHPWWHVSIGVPGARWEASRSNGMFPEFYWLEPHAGEGTYQNGRRRVGVPVDTSEGSFASGAVLRAWRDGGPERPPRGNLAHTFRLRAGQLRYAVTVDSDVYRAPVQQFLIDEIAAPFGQWSVGFTTAAGHSHTRLGLALFPFATRTGPGAPERSVRGHLLQADLDYRNASAFRIALSANARLDASRFRPGGLFP